MTASVPEELPPGFEFGGYLIQDCIGHGGMARVYRAQHTNLRKAVALKVLDRWVIEKPGGTERFLREARTAAAIKHPNVVDIVDVGVWAERPYIVMELLSGCDLDAELERRGPLPDHEVAGLALPIIAGMMAVHEAGVVHRDIKPSNIFLSVGPEKEIVPKVLDFGISKFSDHLIEPLQGLTGTREIVGTPTYMAPEALNGARGLGPRADQYALGAVLYDCAVGRPPFEGATLLELLKAIAVGHVAPPRSVRAEISIELENAILRATRSDPEQRFATLRDLGRALWPLADERTRAIWERTFGGRPRATLDQTTQPLGLKKPATRRPLARRRRWRLPAACAVVAICGGLGFWSIRSRQQGNASSAEQVASLTPAQAGPSAAEAHATAPSVAASPSAAAAGSATGSSEPALAGASKGNSTSPVIDGDARPSKSPARVRAPRRHVRETDLLRNVRQASSAEAATAQDPDLKELFTLPASEGTAPAARRSDADLDGIFPSVPAEARGPNRAPLPD
jgi:tRNA A-37 threonylcarbamoyl transferase component Bud32